ncbi:MAG: tetratricopeptide repeat protein, partial [Planctomycetota bacterium]
MDELDRLLTLAQDAHEKEDFNKKIGYLRDALKLATNKGEIASIHEEIGLSFYSLSDFGEAKKNYFKALENLYALPDSEAYELKWSVNYNLGAAFFDDGDYHNALKYYLEAFKYIESLDAEDAFMVILASGVSYEKLNNLDKAIEFYHKALKVEGLATEDKTMVYQFLGQSYDKNGNEKSAFDCFHKVFSINPNYDGGWYLTYRYAQLAYRFRSYELA